MAATCVVVVDGMLRSAVEPRYLWLLGHTAATARMSARARARGGQCGLSLM